MAQTVEVRFKGTRRAFFTWLHDDDPLRLQESVIVDVERGQDLGRVNSVGEVAAKKCGGSCSCAVSPASEIKSGGTDEPDKTGELGTLAARTESPALPDSPGLPDSGSAALPVPPESESPDLSGSPSSVPSALHAADTKTVQPLPSIIRRAQQPDLAQANELRRAEEEDRRRIVAKAREHGLDMKVSDVEWQWDRRRLTVYFTAEQRVDFRALVRDLAQAFRTRIELRQIGVRDEAARLGGVGRCGRAFCCSTWLTELSPVNLVLAKDQHLSLNPQQISGGCGRLLCCLKYEHDFYVAARKRFPREGKTLVTLRGSEKVIAVDIFRERVFLRGEEEQRIIGLAELREEIEKADGSEPAERTEKAEKTEKTETTNRAGRAGRIDATSSRQRNERTDPVAEVRDAAPSSPASPPSPPSPSSPPSGSSPSSPASPSPSSRRRRRRRRRNPPPAPEG